MNLDTGITLDVDIDYLHILSIMYYILYIILYYIISYHIILYILCIVLYCIILYYIILYIYIIYTVYNTNYIYVPRYGFANRYRHSTIDIGRDRHRSPICPSSPGLCGSYHRQ